jgi:hypothetical protein
VCAKAGHLCRFGRYAARSAPAPNSHARRGIQKKAAAGFVSSIAQQAVNDRADKKRNTVQSVGLSDNSLHQQKRAASKMIMGHTK